MKSKRTTTSRRTNNKSDMKASIPPINTIRMMMDEAMKAGAQMSEGAIERLQNETLVPIGRGIQAIMGNQAALASLFRQNRRDRNASVVMEAYVTRLLAASEKEGKMNLADADFTAIAMAAYGISDEMERMAVLKEKVALAQDAAAKKEEQPKPMPGGDAAEKQCP